jgi:general secretion pathway protein M
MALLDRFNLNPRERRLLFVLGTVLSVVLIVGVPILTEWLIASRASDNEELRQALGDVQEARSQIRDQQAKKDAIAQRYAKRPPALAGFIEQSARAQKLEVTDSTDRPDVPHGKRYVERSTQAHLKKAGMLAIARFLESFEKSGDAVAVTRLSIRKRTGEPDSYDVEVGISAYDRNEQKPAEPKEKEKEPEKKP